MLRIQRTVLNAKEAPPKAKTLTFFDTIEPRLWLPVGVNKSELGSDCAEGGKGVTGLSDCYNQHSSLERIPSGPDSAPQLAQHSHPLANLQNGLSLVPLSTYTWGSWLRS